jgi:hypothetical protein
MTIFLRSIRVHLYEYRMRYITLFFLLAGSFFSQAQLGGTTAFSFLNLDFTGRNAGMGGQQIIENNNDLGAAFLNPSQLKVEMDDYALLSYTNYLTDINFGFLSYARSLDTQKVLAASIFYLDYGTFQRTDESGFSKGTFSARDYIFQTSFSDKLLDYERIRYGTSVKFIYSQYEAYIATAFAIDGALSFEDPEKNRTATLLVKNLGYNAIPYNEVREDLPFEIQFAYSKKLEHNPLRFSIIMHNLQQFDISYVNVNSRNREIDVETGAIKTAEVSFGDKVMRHFIFGGELVFSPNFQLRFGYNHIKRKELAPETNPGMAGFSWGLGVGIKRFKFDYSMSSYFPGINSQTFSVTKNLHDFRKVK